MVLTVGFAQISFASEQTEATQLAGQVVESSGLAAIMKDDQPKDLANLTAALAQGILADAQLKADLIDIRDNVIPQIEKIADQNERESEYFKIQMALTMFAGENGYSENDN